MLLEKKWRFAIVALMGSAHPAIAAAQTADNSGAGPEFQEIVVTARKQSETLIDVPVAVNVVGGDTLQNTATAGLGKLDAVVPQLKFVSGNSGGGATFSIRGIGSSFIDAGLEQSVSVAIDGIQIGRGNIINDSFFDTAQIEVLKGPQALFFGKNSPAGVVSIKTRNPSDVFEGYVTAGYEFKADERFVEGAVSVPVSDALALRIAGRVSGMEGYLKNEAQPSPDYIYNPFLATPLSQPGAPDSRAPGSTSYAGRITALYRPDDRLTAILKVAVSQYDDNGSSNATHVICSPEQQFPITALFVSYTDTDTRCDNRDFTTSYGQTPEAFAAGVPGLRDGKPFTDTRSTLASLSLDYDAGAFSITSTTGYFNLLKDYSLYVVSNSAAHLPIGSKVKNDTFSQELRIASQFEAPINFMIGGYFEDYLETIDNATVPFFQGTDPATGLNATVMGGSRAENTTYSLFGQAQWEIHPDLELAAGVRWTDEKKVTSIGNTYINPVGDTSFLLPTSVVLAATVPSSNFSPEVTLTWHPRNNLTVYAAYKTGYKSGGISIPSFLSAGLAAVGGEGLKFDAEESKGGEVGAKGYFLGRRLRAELTGYYYNYDNFQVSAFNPAAVSFFIDNAAKARVKGIEGSVDFRLLDDLTLKAAVGYNHARYVSFPGAPCSSATGCSVQVGPAGPVRFHDLAGEPLVLAPDWSGNAGFNYDTRISGNVRLGLSGDVDFSSSYFTSVENDPAVAQPAYARINAGIRVHADNDRWEVALIGRNLNNKFVIGGSSTVPVVANQYWVTVGRPRQVVLQTSFRF